MKAQELREKFLNFFKDKGHKIIPSASLIPEHDPTALFTSAGMHPLVPYLLGQKHPLGKRLCNVQKCIRTQDIEEVGDKSHLTFFEMLGNWSLGDYWKKEAIEWALEFLTEELDLDKDDLRITCFKGDKETPRDKEAARIWRELGIENIEFLGRQENWWGPVGKTGPCGPDTEVFVKGIEVWNLVFMQYDKQEDGNFVSLEQKNVDTGMGLERVLMILNNKKESVYKTELFAPIMEEVQKAASPQDDRRIIADHIKAATFILSEKIEPSNKDQGYILRRLLRRLILKSPDLNLKKLSQAVVDIYGRAYSQLTKNQDFIFTHLEKEKARFKKTLKKGRRQLNKYLATGKLTAQQAFDLYQTFGFPFELTQEIAAQKGIQVSRKDFEKFFKKHQEKSRQAGSKKFKAGLADHQEQTVKLHTATHLLLAALREVLGDHIEQAGSNITPERLRFDFTHPKPLKEKEITQVEKKVNEKINQGLKVYCREMPLKEAKECGAVATFEGRYPDRVSVYSIGGQVKGPCYSKEICKGPHIENTEELGRFEIIKEQSSSSGVRRIRAILK